MDFHVGDPVIHWSFGFGKIVSIEERVHANRTAPFYFVEIAGLTICVPIDSQTESRLRSPKTALEFRDLFAILREEGEVLPENRIERKATLRKKLTDGSAETVCQVVRDLTAMARKKPLSDDDRSILRRAEGLLCAEWAYSLSVPLAQAGHDLEELLGNPSFSPL